MKELGQLHGSAKLRKEREVKSIAQEMEDVDAQLDALDQKSPDSNRQYLILEEDLHEIDFTEVKKVVDRIISQINRDEGGNASFLLQRSLLREGRLCLLQIKKYLRNITRDLKSYHIEFSVDTELNHIGLLNRLASHLGIEPIADPVRANASKWGLTKKTNICCQKCGYPCPNDSTVRQSHPLLDLVVSSRIILRQKTQVQGKRI
jgi:hypothetical protein